MTDDRSDEALMTAYVGGDARALRELFRRHAPRLIRVMAGHLGSTADAQDVVQAAFLNLHRARRDFRAGSRLQPWLYTIAYNLMRDHHRYRGRRPELLTEPTGPGGHDTRPSQAPGPDADLYAAPIRRALAQLPEAQREVIVLHWFAGFSFAEVADLVGARRTAVKVRAHRGYKRLRELLGPEYLELGGADSEAVTVQEPKA
ncbi:RNA polymerase sigma factor [Enhygromyxa salina]|uniref:RNA polymerase sigma factor n=1 Tax=Enhygromyxa salina TaxID=215803 RepID=UPI001FD1327B|nr:RNA polymerase sigma factor [Enhygromyxa salina]